MDRQTIDVSSDLNAICSEEFEAKVAFASMPAVLRKLILQSNELNRLRVDLKLNLLTETRLRNFVEEVVARYEKGKRLPHEIALAVIAVLVETRSTEFAEEFLIDLARLKLSEMQNAIGVTKECLKRRKTQPRETVRGFDLAGPESEAAEQEPRFVSHASAPPRSRRVADFAYA